MSYGEAVLDVEHLEPMADFRERGLGLRSAEEATDRRADAVDPERDVVQLLEACSADAPRA